MKYYHELAEFPVFTLEQAGDVMGSAINAPKNLNLMIKEGGIHRVRKNLYTCINLVTGEDVANRFEIGSGITDCSFIAYHTAFEFYGFYNQVFYEVQVSSQKKFLPFEYESYNYKCFLTSCDKQIDLIAGVRVSSIERTIIDSINMLGKVMDVEELVKCMELVHVVKEDKLIEMLLAYDKDILYRKAGYVLSVFKNEYRLSDDFFIFCKEHSNIQNGGSISSEEIGKLSYIQEWGLYAYPELRRLTDKGDK